MKITFILLLFLLLHQPMTNNQIVASVCSCCCNWKREEAKLSLLFSNCDFHSAQRHARTMRYTKPRQGNSKEKHLYFYSTNVSFVSNQYLVHVIWTGCRMLKLVLNVKYLLVLSFLTVVKFYNFGQIQG